MLCNLSTKVCWPQLLGVLLPRCQSVKYLTLSNVLTRFSEDSWRQESWIQRIDFNWRCLNTCLCVCMCCLQMCFQKQNNLSSFQRAEITFLKTWTGPRLSVECLYEGHVTREITMVWAVTHTECQKTLLAAWQQDGVVRMRRRWRCWQRSNKHRPPKQLMISLMITEKSR